MLQFIPVQEGTVSEEPLGTRGSQTNSLIFRIRSRRGGDRPQRTPATVTAGHSLPLRLRKPEVQLFLNRVCANDRCSGAFQGPVLFRAVGGRSGSFQSSPRPPDPDLSHHSDLWVTVDRTDVGYLKLGLRLKFGMSWAMG